MHATTTRAIGRRKTSVARVILTPGTGKIQINNRPFEDYFPLATMQTEISRPLVVTENSGKFDVRVSVEGGGMTGQAGAISLGIARALVQVNEEFRPALRGAGLMTRDPRMVERKKYGQKKARKRFQFSKR